MGCYYTLCYNTYAYSLLFYKVYIKRENDGNWDSGLERSKYWRPILHGSKSPETSWKSISEYIKNTERKKFLRGATPYPRGWGARPTPWARPPTSWAPWWPSSGHVLLYEFFRWKKIGSHILRRNSAATRRNLGGTNLGL